MTNVLSLVPNTNSAPSSQVLRILNWNRRHNSLQYDVGHEASALSSSSNDFFMAETLVDRLHAYCDFVFVSVGAVLTRHPGKYIVATMSSMM